MMHPAVGRIVPATTTQTRASSADKQLDARYFQLKYAYYYQADSRAQPAELRAEQYIFHAPGRTGKQLATAVEVLPTAILADNGSYKMRRSATDSYKELDRKIGDKHYTVMAKADGTEVVAFLPRDQQVLTIALVSGMSDDLLSELDQILATFSWK